jgi:hypothetical protein
MGLFDVNMPLLYGEGRTRALRRLFIEIEQNNRHATVIETYKTLVQTPDYIIQVRINPSI